jgi:hypothetical protein
MTKRVVIGVKSALGVLSSPIDDVVQESYGGHTGRSEVLRVDTGNAKGGYALPRRKGSRWELWSGFGPVIEGASTSRLCSLAGRGRRAEGRRGVQSAEENERIRTKSRLSRAMSW